MPGPIAPAPCPSPAVNDESGDIWYSPPHEPEYPMEIGYGYLFSAQQLQKYDPKLYDKESISEFLTQEEAIRLKAGRSTLFELKISILNELLKALKVKNEKKLWDKYLRLLTEGITAPGVKGITGKKLIYSRFFNSL